jgi:hypothetical protein
MLYLYSVYILSGFCIFLALIFCFTFDLKLIVINMLINLITVLCKMIGAFTSFVRS